MKGRAGRRGGEDGRRRGEDIEVGDEIEPDQNLK